MTREEFKPGKNMENYEFLNGLYTLEEQTEYDINQFEERVESISGIKWDGFIKGISRKKQSDLMEKEGIGNPFHLNPFYKEEERFLNDIINSSKEIASFLKSDPGDILYFWSSQDPGGEKIVSKAFSKFFDMGERGNIIPKKELGSPVNTIRFSESPEGQRGYEHWVMMYESKGGERFCLQGTYSGDRWMCTRSLIGSLLSKI